MRAPILNLLLIASCAGTSLAQAQTQGQTIAPAPQTAAISPDAIKQREQELEAARARQKSAEEAQAKLKAEIASLGQDRTQLNQQLIDTAANVRTVETKIDEAEARLKTLNGREQQARASLDSRRADIVEVLAALQRAGRRTPPALLVRPEDALQSLRTAILLGAVVPELRGRAEKIASELGELVALRKNIAAERDQLASDRDNIRSDQTRLAALVDERQRQQASREKDLDAENSRAITLSKQVGDLQGLIAKMEQDLQSAAKAAEKAAEAAKQAEAKEAKEAKAAAANAAANAKPGPAIFKDRSRTSPAILFASAKGLLPLPVNGNKIRDFGGSDGVGGVQKGISLATKPGSQVTTPCDGWVVYAGPFRSYGQLLILNAGGGYHVLIAGMERISVNIGQFVLTGEPVATMGSTSQVASILATNASQPVLYVEFRKDGTPIDPGPWWAANEGEKVRG
ncbi:peptidoglycan DD-metalloendopeptidase family protein [Bradyrhizobium sp. WYCCWR 13023]|uniref:Peptidoglycan DD-metalloendopeptidase family protein n=1 Tax=Bradyrhizobium zhengyangense TaxID=2911009 RepID=A0A9X1RDM8_9BRAD|nr:MULTISPECIES: peptidoglycan DD-metalloendopeptidase family protein [Bradyrhizobium]MCG2630011.1 peptidoglycan DD-metalloendopeptidase family protein [Bradyrhizobium zhengyangense]MCG2639554.1 peptidoglycan DD-metalloendopeptidase family protein [Bradyrhizobium zhengyangense]MCG2672490.1 peptidoglycan DD-metalloendopeptidase family protein [Bradyrhizobium zhengyangense]MDA9522616.1 membrane protein [Bradyrhizobium sp. CCBAU 11434]